jgi:hypothetical protein
MNALKITGLILLFLAFFVAGGIFIFGKGVQETFLQTSFYEEVVDQADISPLLINELLGGVEQRAAPRLERLPGNSDQVLRGSLRSSFSEALNEEWAEETVLTTVEDGLSYLKGEQEELTAVIDLEERKDIIKSNIEERVEEGIDTEVEEQMQEREDVPAGAEEQVRRQIESEINSEMDTAIIRVMNETPDKVALADILERHPNAEEIKTGIGEFQRIRDFFNTYSYPILIALILLIFLLAGILDGLKWAGTAMIVSGGFLMAFLFGIEKAMLTFLNDIGLGVGVEEMKILTEPFFAEMKSIILYYMSAGIIALMAGLFIKKRGGKKGAEESVNNS